MFSQTMFKKLTDDAAQEPVAELASQLRKALRTYGGAPEGAFVIKSLLTAIKGTNPLNGDAIRQAAILDALAHRVHFVKKLIGLGAVYTRDDIEDIRPVNKEAAEMLERHLRMRAKL